MNVCDERRIFKYGNTFPAKATWEMSMVAGVLGQH